MKGACHPFSFAYVFCEFEGFCASTRDFCIAWLTVNVATRKFVQKCKQHNSWWFKNEVRKDQRRKVTELWRIFLDDKTTNPHTQTLQYWQRCIRISIAALFFGCDRFPLLCFSHVVVAMFDVHEEKINLQWGKAHDLCKSMFDFGMVIEWYIYKVFTHSHESQFVCSNAIFSDCIYEISDELSDSAVESKLHAIFGLRIQHTTMHKIEQPKYFSQFTHNDQFFPVQRMNTKYKSIVFIARNMVFIEFPFGDSVYVHFLLFDAFLVGFLDPPFLICWHFECSWDSKCIEMCQNSKKSAPSVWLSCTFAYSLNGCKKAYWWM